MRTSAKLVGYVNLVRQVRLENVVIKNQNSRNMLKYSRNIPY